MPSRDLRDALFELFDQVKAGQIKDNTAMVLVNIAKQINNASKTQLQREIFEEYLKQRQNGVPLKSPNDIYSLGDESENGSEH